MITKEDCIVLLSNLQDMGIDCKSEINKTLKSDDISIDILKFINDNRQMDLTKFYEKIRKSYNHKKSVLYKNLMVELNEDNIQDVLTTLNSYSLQIHLFAKDVEDRQMFYRFARLEEIYKCLLRYSQTFDLQPCIKLLRLIKADIKVLESTYRK